MNAKKQRNNRNNAVNRNEKRETNYETNNLKQENEKGQICKKLTPREINTPRGHKTCKTANQKHNKTNEVENKTKGIVPCAKKP